MVWSTNLGFFKHALHILYASLKPGICYVSFDTREVVSPCKHYKSVNMTIVSKQLVHGSTTQHAKLATIIRSSRGDPNISGTEWLYILESFHWITATKTHKQLFRKPNCLVNAQSTQGRVAAGMAGWVYPPQLPTHSGWKLRELYHWSYINDFGHILWSALGLRTALQTCQKPCKSRWLK